MVATGPTSAKFSFWLEPLVAPLDTIPTFMLVQDTLSLRVALECRWCCFCFVPVSRGWEAKEKVVASRGATMAYERGGCKRYIVPGRFWSPC